ncbi:MAG: hypothetical protein HOF97_02865 [Candidatus Marinimicrobia bacterium]|nr:hypothetical protein [Candidatus Neomarinimicrobiota bacterium]
MSTPTKRIAFHTMGCKLNFVVLDNIGNAKTTTKVDEDLILESLKVLN